MRLTMEELYRRLVLAESRVTSLERQLSIDLGTGLISLPTGGGDGTIYLPISMPGRVRLATATPYRVPVACTLTSIRVNMTTASSSGSVTARLNIGVSDYDVTITSGNTSGSSTPGVSLSAGDLIIAEITAAGTNAEDLTALVELTP
jgi:hypothetical protein